MLRTISNTIGVSRAALAEEKLRPRVKRSRDELEFLPAAVEVLETPASPIGRAIVFLILIVFVVAVAWAYWGHIDTVAVAQGKIIPGGRVKTIQALEIGVVRAIHVRDGQHVKDGELLIELDPTESDANRERLWRELMAARLDLARFEAMIDKGGDAGKAFSPPEGADPALVVTSRALLHDTMQEHRARLASLDARVSELEANRATINARIHKLSAMMPLLKERVDAHQALVSKKVAARTDYLELKQELVEMQQDRAIERRRLEETAASTRSLKEQRLQAEAEISARAHEQLVEASRRGTALEQELRKAEERHRLRQLRAPVNGVVQQLAVHTIGGVVAPAERIMIIVPEDSPLEIEAFVLNKDIGFVETGQPVEIKVESFPFTKYGLIDGQVTQISADAVQDEQQGLTYPARIAMSRDKILVDTRWVQLTPGMAVTVEVKTGQRRVIEFFLSPFLRYQDEALKER